ncbi:hypothetical protein V866_002986 [Kwoniella sp. B9012]
MTHTDITATMQGQGTLRLRGGGFFGLFRLTPITTLVSTSETQSELEKPYKSLTPTGPKAKTKPESKAKAKKAKTTTYKPSTVPNRNDGTGYSYNAGTYAIGYGTPYIPSCPPTDLGNGGFGHGHSHGDGNGCDSGGGGGHHGHSGDSGGAGGGSSCGGGSSGGGVNSGGGSSCGGGGSSCGGGGSSCGGGSS